jgi:tetratricopeptide (TPR) repeat protein
VLEKIPFFVLTVASSVVTYLAQQSAGAVATAEKLPIELRVPNAVTSYVKYLFKTFWPTKLAIFYPFPDAHFPGSEPWATWQIILAAFVLLAISVAAVWYWKRLPWMATGWFWYLGMLVPVIGLLHVGMQAMADRYSYLPSIGIFICVVWGVSELARHSRLAMAAVSAAGAAVLVACAIATHVQVGYWRDVFTVFGHALDVTTNNGPANFSLGTALAQQGKIDSAIRHLRAACATEPSYADAHYNLGLALMSKGQLDQAVEAFGQTLALAPEHWLAHDSLGAALWRLGKLDDALAQYAEAARINPNDSNAHYSLGSLLLERGKPAEASAQFAMATRLRPSFIEALTGLGRSLATEGKLDEALTQFRELVRLLPNSAEAHVNVGNALMLAGRTNEATASFAAALRFDPAVAAKRAQTGKELLDAGQPTAAVSCLFTAIQLDPNNADATRNLGLALARQGRIEEALRYFEAAVRLRPDAQTYYDLGLACVMNHHPEQAVHNYEEAIRLKPTWPEPLNDLAWLRATSAQAELRNGAEAVILAEKACKLAATNEARFYGTLAAAYAEAGRYDDAVSTAGKAITLANSSGQKPVEMKNQELLKLYQARQPYHDDAGPK